MEAMPAVPFFSLPWLFSLIVSEAATVPSGTNMCICSITVPRLGIVVGEGSEEGKGSKMEEANFLPSFRTCGNIPYVLFKSV